MAGDAFIGLDREGCRGLVVSSRSGRPPRPSSAIEWRPGKVLRRYECRDAASKVGEEPFL